MKNHNNSKLENMEKRKILIPKALDWVMLALLGIDREKAYYLTMSLIYKDHDILFISVGWSNIFNIRDALYRELIIEFYATIRFDFEITTRMIPYVLDRRRK